MPINPAGPDNRPSPDAHHQKVNDEQLMRLRMLEGGWDQDAERVFQSYFDKSTHDFLPPPVLSFNIAKALSEQSATLYNEGVGVQIKGKPSAQRQRTLGLDRLWAQMRDAQVKVRMIQDCWVKRSWSERHQRVNYLVVPPSDVDRLVADPDDPQQAVMVRHLRKRSGIRGVEGIDPDLEYWCWDIWDLRDRENPRFEIRLDSQAENVEPVDITRAALSPTELDAAGEGNWPLTDETGAPIWPWTGYHARVSGQLVHAFEGNELVDGTLIGAALWTMVVGGMRDVAFAQRVMIDAQLKGVRNHDGTDWVPTNPMMVWRIESTKADRPGAISQWSSAMKVEEMVAAVSHFVSTVALTAGYSPADVTLSNAGLARTSGLAIEVSRDGKRKIEAGQAYPMSLSDQHNLAGAALIANAYAKVKPNLKTDAEDYTMIYARTGKTSAEIKLETEEVVAQIDAGLLDMRDAVVKIHPHMTRDEAGLYLIEAAEFKKLLTGGSPTSDDEGAGDASAEDGDGDGDGDPGGADPGAGQEPGGGGSGEGDPGS